MFIHKTIWLGFKYIIITLSQLLRVAMHKPSAPSSNYPLWLPIRSTYREFSSIELQRAAPGPARQFSVSSN